MLKPVDIFVLGALCFQPDGWTQTDIARQLDISQSSVNRALRQLRMSSLWRAGRVHRAGVVELFVHGIKYVYPPRLGAPTRGIATAHSAPGIVEHFPSSTVYVWPNEEGDAFGTALVPLHPKVPIAALKNPGLYDLMSTVDVLRIGRAREKALATQRVADLLGAR